MLTKLEVLKKFLPEEGKAEKVIDTFVGMWGLEADKEETKTIIEKVRTNPDQFVLKPQLEGGGCNIYGRDILTTLDSLTDDQKEAYVVMQKIETLKIKVIFRGQFPS